jgi:molybdate transport system ATP-binding protein
VLISLENVAVELNQTVLLENISLEIKTHDVLQIQGANGSGKSTLLKLLYGDHWHTQGTRTYFFSSPRASPIGAKQFTALVSPEIQERYQRLNHDRTALEVLQTGHAQTDFLYTALEPNQQQQTLAFAAQFELGALLEQPFHQLSKGQMRQVLLARALIPKPRVLFLDEFFSGVDTVARERLRGIVATYLEQGGTLVYTTHRHEKPFVQNEKIVLLKHGKIVTDFQNSTANNAVMQTHNTRESLTQNTRAGQTQGSAPTEKLEKLIEGRTQQKPEILIEVVNASVFLGEPLDDATAPDGHALTNRTLVLENISFTLIRRQHWCITGQNGAGKSTFAKLLRGDLNPAFGGQVRWFGSSQMPIWERQTRIALVSSDAQVWHRVDATGFEVIASGFAGGIGWHRPLTATEQTQVEWLLVALEIQYLASRNALYASQGELRKLLIARALVTKPDVLILDEAFDYLDANSRQLVWQVLLDQPSTLLVVAHRTEDQPPFATQHLEIQKGRIILEA